MVREAPLQNSQKQVCPSEDVLQKFKGVERSCRVPTLVSASTPFVPEAPLSLLTPLLRSLCPAVCPMMRPTSSPLLGHLAPFCTSGHPLMTSGSSQPRAGPWEALLSTWDKDKGWRMTRMTRRLKVEGWPAFGSSWRVGFWGQVGGPQGVLDSSGRRSPLSLMRHLCLLQLPHQGPLLAGPGH